MSNSKKNKDSEKASLPAEVYNDENIPSDSNPENHTEDSVTEPQPGENFEDQSPLLNEDVIERKNDLLLEAQPVQEELKENLPPKLQSFGKPRLDKANPISDLLPKMENDTPQEAPKSVPPNTRTDTFPEQDADTESDGLPKMKVEEMDNEEVPQTLDGIKKKAGQTTAKWSWTLFENAGPKLQLFFSELDEAEIRKFVLEDLLPPEAIDFAKDYNTSLEDEFKIKDWEKELIYPPLEEMLEQAGMNASMSPGARFGVGITVVLGARAIQTKKYRQEREELVERLIKSYAQSKGEKTGDNENLSTEGK